MFQDGFNFWRGAIERNVLALRAAIAPLLALVAGQAGEMPRALHSSILRVLRPAESALRRLIVIAAQDVKVEVSAPRKRTTHTKTCARKIPKVMAFRLIDPRKAIGRQAVVYTKRNPRISFIDFDLPFAPMFLPPPQDLAARPPPEKQLNMHRLSLRLNAVNAALDDLPRQALRLAKYLATRGQSDRPKLLPLRTGRPPGFRKHPWLPVDLILTECHTLAKRRLAEADTS